MAQLRDTEASTVRRCPIGNRFGGYFPVTVGEDGFRDVELRDDGPLAVAERRYAY